MRLIYNGATFLAMNYNETIKGDYIRILIDKGNFDIMEVKEVNLTNSGYGIEKKFENAKINSYGKHKLCDVNFKWYDGMIICPKCNFVLELE